MTLIGLLLLALSFAIFLTIKYLNNKYDNS
jgi:hypothetical protein